ncbi:MAG TPA: arsenite methyltransferase [Flavisolibacter sp.]|nr:arsenite methyltransferase [Flavisolibacter sp.]
MNTPDQIKELVKQKYSGIALQEKETNQASCCGATSGCCNQNVYNIMADDYSQLEGYNADADMGLGCGLPTKFARIKKDDTVVDLGSGAGNDAFIARQETGENGKVIGIDFTPAMLERSRKNAEARGFHNVEFRQGDIEDMPLTSNTADVVVSNCVLNLVPNKHKVFSEIFRVLKPGGHFSISDIVLEGELPEKWKQVAELYAGCVSGAIPKQQYLSIIEEAGFSNTALQKQKNILIPDEILANHLTADEIRQFKDSGTSIQSITVYAEKPAKDERKCCEPGNSCC